MFYLFCSAQKYFFSSHLRKEGLSDVILYHQPDDKKKNRGFCFLEYEDHKTAAQARRRLMSGKVKVWGNVVTVEWADPIEDPDPEVMAKVSISNLELCDAWAGKLYFLVLIFKNPVLVHVINLWEEGLR